MRATQVQPQAAAQQARTHPAPAQLPSQPPLSPEQLAGGCTPLKQQLPVFAAAPATPAAHPTAARLPSWTAASFGAAAVMPGGTVNLELSEDALFPEEFDGQDPGVGHEMSSDGEDDAQFTPQQQRPAAALGTPGSAARSTPGLPGAGGAGADSGSDSSDEDIGTEFAQAAELHRSSSAGGLAGASSVSPAGARTPSALGTPGSASSGAPDAPGSGGGGAQEALIPAFGATPARPPPQARAVSIASPVPSSRKKLAIDSAGSKLGTSVPIAIPMGLREDRDSTPDSPEEPGGIHAATFVPPHMLESVRSGALDASNSVQGTSPAASLKRERLVNRNAILRRTGFLEGSQGAAFLETMDPIRESAFESLPPPLATPGALSRALGTAAGSSV